MNRRHFTRLIRVPSGHPAPVWCFEERPADAADGEAGSLAESVSALSLGRYVRKLRERNDRFGELLRGREVEDEEVTADGVRAAFYQGQEHLLQAVVMVLSRYPMSSVEHVAARAALLAPVASQEEQIATYQRSRRKVPDVDPGSGEENNDDAGADDVTDIGDPTPPTT